LVTALNKIRAQGHFHRAAKRDVRMTCPIQAVDESQQKSLADDQTDLVHLELFIDEALEYLSPAHRQMVKLRIEGYGVGEIAAKTGRAKRSVERLLQEARKKLSVLLQEEI